MNQRSVLFVALPAMGAQRESGNFPLWILCRISLHGHEPGQHGGVCWCVANLSQPSVALVKLVSADANGKQLGGDFATMKALGTLMTFTTLGSASSPGTSDVFLNDPFFYRHSVATCGPSAVEVNSQTGSLQPKVSNCDSCE